MVVELGPSEVVDIQLTRTHSIVPAQLEWHNVTCSVQAHIKGQQKEVQILHGVSGVVKPGELVAIMGSSGAGKTTLFNLLTQRITEDQYKEYSIGGDITINGKPITPELFRQYGAYVMQHDLLMHTLTPREAIKFCAGLKLPVYMTQEEKDARVENIINNLRIQKCADSLIGNQRIPGISGGERKRTAIGVELVANPSMIFLDEPSTGLDSFTTLKLMLLLKRMANSGRTVVMTIHQPSEEVFELFDKLILLSSGRTIYNGPTSGSMQYFASLGYPCPPSMNPADYFLRTMEHHSQSQKAEFFRAYERSPMALAHLDANEEYTELPEKLDFDRVDRWTEFKMLLARSWKHHVRQPETMWVFWSQLLFMGIFLGLLYFQLDVNQASITNRLGLLYNCIMFMTMSGVINCLATFPDERPLFLREKANNMYSPNMYFISKTISEAIWLVFYGIVFASIIYWMTGLRNDVMKFFIFLVTCLFAENVGKSMGMLVGSAVSEVEMALTLMPFTIVPFSLVCGMFITNDEVPTFLEWMKWVSGFRFGYELFCINEFEGLEFYCESEEYQVADDGTTYCEYMYGEDVLVSLDIYSGYFYLNFAFMGMIYVICMGIAWYLLVNRKDRV